jgi:23S rRNA pseudouridine1911/1915/1917 synthase
MQPQPVICHEASGVIGVFKPAGLPTQAPGGIASLEAWLRARLPAGGYLGVPHRLDRAVSGVMLFASTPRAARQLSRQFERRQITKTYVALVTVGASSPAAREARWIDWIEKVPDEPRARIVAAATATAREAQTLVREIGRPALVDGIPLVMLHLEPHTGRMHQLRVQAASRGMPILGDAAYGGAEWPGVAIDDRRLRPIALHARRIAFTDPEGGGPVVLSAPLPPCWPQACHALLAEDAGGARGGAETAGRGYS